MLTERQIEVVLSIVSEYIQSGESVGSRTVSKRYLTRHSAATIRNEMADLEEMGYLLQPHTSAGRMPTTLAYRLYLDSVLQRRKLLFNDSGLSKNIQDSRKNIETFLLYVSELLGNLSSYMGIAAVTHIRELKFRRVDFLRMDTSHMLLIIILEGGYVHHKMVPMPCDVSQESLEKLARKVNCLEGMPWSEVGKTLHNYLQQELGIYKEACQKALLDLDTMFKITNTRLVTSSMRQLLNLPDFQDMARIKALLSIIEQEEALAELVQSCGEQDGVNAIIGDEHELQDMKDCSLVILSLGDSHQRTMFGVIGPQRMHYEKVISILEQVVLGLNEEKSIEED